MYSHTKAKELFDRVAEGYEDKCEQKVFNFSSMIFQHRINIVKEMIRKAPSPGRVLDFGMGPAVFGPTCINHGLRYLGIDISPVMVERARAAGLQDAEFIVGDLESLKPFEAQMNAVIAIGLIDYLEHPDKGLEALANAVRPDGHLIISFRNRFSVPSVTRDAAKRVWHLFSSKKDSQSAFAAQDVHEHSFSAPYLESILKKLGYTVLETRYFNASPFFFSFPMSEGLWKSWLSIDTKLAGKFTRWMCSGGVIAARRKK